MSEKVNVLISEKEVDARIQEIADQINKDYAGKEIHMICVLKGGVFFMCELAKRILFRYLSILCLYPVTGTTQSQAVWLKS